MAASFQLSKEAQRLLLACAEQLVRLRLDSKTVASLDPVMTGFHPRVLRNLAGHGLVEPDFRRLWLTDRGADLASMLFPMANEHLAAAFGEPTTELYEVRSVGNSWAVYESDQPASILSLYDTEDLARYVAEKANEAPFSANAVHLRIAYRIDRPGHLVLRAAGEGHLVAGAKAAPDDRGFVVRGSTPFVPARALMQVMETECLIQPEFGRVWRRTDRGTAVFDSMSRHPYIGTGIAGLDRVEVPATIFDDVCVYAVALEHRQAIDLQ